MNTSTVFEDDGHDMDAARHEKGTGKTGDGSDDESRQGKYRKKNV